MKVTWNKWIVQIIVVIIVGINAPVTLMIAQRAAKLMYVGSNVFAILSDTLTTCNYGSEWMGCLEFRFSVFFVC